MPDQEKDLPPLDPLDWEGAAQDAAFEGVCFSTLRDGRMINADALSAAYTHEGPFDHLFIRETATLPRKKVRTPCRTCGSTSHSSEAVSLVAPVTLFPVTTRASSQTRDLRPELPVAA